MLAGIYNGSTEGPDAPDLKQAKYRRDQLTA
jgi:hypothetical protein